MNCIISCAVNNSHCAYENLLQQQRESHKTFCPEIARLDWSGGWPPGARPHSASNYGFKVHAFAEAFRQEHDCVLWLDSCIRLLRHPRELFDMIANDGYLIMNGGGLLPTSIRPDLPAHLGVTVAQHWCISAGQAIGFNRQHATGMSIYKEWAQLEATGWFSEGGHSAHRHDEACLGLLVQRDNAPFSNQTGHYTGPNPIYMSHWYNQSSGTGGLARQVATNNGAALNLNS